MPTPGLDPILRKDNDFYTIALKDLNMAETAAAKSLFSAVPHPNYVTHNLRYDTSSTGSDSEKTTCIHNHRNHRKKETLRAK